MKNLLKRKGKDSERLFITIREFYHNRDEICPTNYSVSLYRLKQSGEVIGFRILLECNNKFHEG